MSNLQAAIDVLAPVKTVVLRRKARPWIDTYLQHLICKCDAVQARYKRTGRATLLDEFLDLRRVIE